MATGSERRENFKQSYICGTFGCVPYIRAKYHNLYTSILEYYIFLNGRDFKSINQNYTGSVKQRRPTTVDSVLENNRKPLEPEYWTKQTSSSLLSK